MKSATNCRKCGAPMREMPAAPSTSALYGAKLTVTGYRCACGHYNDLKRRKEKGGVK